MDIFEQLVLPPSSHTIHLTDIFLILSLLLFLPFVGMVIGGSTFAMIFAKLGERTGNKNYLRFSKDILDKLSVNKNVGVGLGIVPAFSITFVYAQLLYTAPVISVSTMLLASIIYVAGFIFIYRYQRTFEIDNVLDKFKNFVETKYGATGREIPRDVLEYEKKNTSVNQRSGSLGLFFLYVASFLFIGGSTIAADPMKWGDVGNILGFLIVGEVWINFLYFLAVSAAISGGAVLFFFFKWQGGLKGMTDDYKSMVMKFAVSVGFIGTILQLFLLLAKFLGLTQNALSTSVFIYTLLAMISILIVCNLLYAIIKNYEVKFSAAVFFFMMITFMFSILKDEAVLANAVKEHLAPIIAEQDKYIDSKINVAPEETAIDGSQIYSTQCIACHKFDAVVVGPPYDQTLPKYEGDVKRLAAYIYNPTKIDPGYPAMPNQGLSMAQAEAVAQYLIDTYHK